MAAVTRQPFAPLDGTRLQNLTSLKNRQNAISPPASKRKADSLLDTDDAENVDPLLFAAKRSKAAKGASASSKDSILKPSSFVLTTAKSTLTPISKPSATPSFLSAATTPRRTLQPKSPAARLNTSISKSSPLSAPAGRSPTRGKRSGILSSRRRTAGPYSRVEPPSFKLGSSSSAPFSLDAALKGTIPSYGSRSTTSTPSLAKASSSSLVEDPDMKASWFFDIHEDTPEQEMTNLLQHGTCVLDISSDEESKQRARREDREDKENVPPVDDVSQTSARRQMRRRDENDMVVEKERVALGEMTTSDFFAEGCDESSVIIVPGDEEEQQQQQQQQEQEPSAPIAKEFEFAPELKSSAPAPAPESVPLPEEPEVSTAQEDIDVLMGRTEESSPSKAAVLQPIEGTGESFDLWESGSTKDEGESNPAATAEVASS